jgi:hypothetical protein
LKARILEARRPRRNLLRKGGRMAFRMVTARTGARTEAGGRDAGGHLPGCRFYRGACKVKTVSAPEKKQMTKTNLYGLMVLRAFPFIAVFALLAIGCSSGDRPTSATSEPQVAAPGPDHISGTAPVTALVSDQSGTNKTTTWSNGGDGIFIARFKNKHNVEPGYATLGCLYSDTHPETFIDQTQSQKFEDMGAYHFRLEAEVACGRTIECELLRTGPQGFSEAQKGNRVHANDVIASHGFSTNHCVTPKPEPTPTCNEAVTFDYGQSESGTTITFFNFRAKTPSGPLAGTFELGGKPLPNPFHVTRTTVVQTFTVTFVSSLGCRTDFTLTAPALGR